MKTNRKVVIVIDMINGFCKEGALHDTNILRIVPVIEDELNTVASDDRIFIIDTHKADAMEFQAFPPHCLSSTSQAEIIDELKGYVKDETHCIRKNSTNAIWCMDIEELSKQYDEFVLVGCCSDICVLQLALSMRTYFNQKEYKKEIVVLEKGIATYDIEQLHPAKTYHQFALDIMKNAGIMIR